MTIEELQQDKAKKFDALLIEKWRLEHRLQAVTEEMAKVQGAFEALAESKECVNDDKQ